MSEKKKPYLANVVDGISGLFNMAGRFFYKAIGFSTLEKLGSDYHSFVVAPIVVLGAIGGAVGTDMLADAFQMGPFLEISTLVAGMLTGAFAGGQAYAQTCAAHERSVKRRDEAKNNPCPLPRK